LELRWWIDAEGEGDRVEGVLYTVCSNFDSESEFLLHLKKEEDREKIKSLEVGVSGRHYALVPEGLWLRALKRLVTIFFFNRFWYVTFRIEINQKFHLSDVPGVNRGCLFYGIVF
jgi:hypothetical protein